MRPAFDRHVSSVGRCVVAYECRLKGWKLRMIGLEFGVKVERARQMVEKGRRIVAALNAGLVS